VELNYDYKVVDVFSMENKTAKALQKANFLQLVAGLKQSFNPDPGLKQIGEETGFTSDELTDILGTNSFPQPTPAAQGMGMPSLPRPTKQNNLEMPPMEENEMMQDNRLQI